MEEDPILLTLHKLKKQNHQMIAQKERINDLKAIKQIKKTNELKATIENLKEIEADIAQLDQQ